MVSKIIHPEVVAAGTPGPASPELSPAARKRLRGLLLVSVLLCAGFGQVLFDLGNFALGNDLFSYIPLIPLVSAYLVWEQRKRLHLESLPVRRWAAVPAGVGLALQAWFWIGLEMGLDFADSDYLALMVASLLAFLVAAAMWFLGPRTLRTVAFPAAFLVFAVPLPEFAHQAIETFLQHASADVAYVFFLISQTAVIRDGLIFHLPDINLEVAPECSGIHSTLMLLVTSVLAAHLFLRSSGRRAILVLFVVPLALLRNGVRICIIGELCVHIGPQMINSYIHRHGGPIFFAASLVPFFYLLRYLHRSESARARAVGGAPAPTPATS